MVFGAVFLLTLPATLTFIVLNGTLLDPHYYPDVVQRSQVYRFATGEVLTTAIDEARQVDADQFGGIFRENPISTSGLSTQQIAGAVSRGFSSRDLERLASPVLFRIGEYVRGDRETLVVTLGAERVRSVTGELHELMHESGAYDSLIDHELEPRVRDAAGEMLGADENVSAWTLYLFGDADDAEDAEDWIVRIVMSSLTADWLSGQVGHALDELTAYLVGETDDFEITVRLTGAEVDRAVEETKAILREADAYELVYTGVVEPVLTDLVWPATRLPDGATATREEVIYALRQAAPPSWVQQEAEALIDQVGPYVVGRSDSFSMEIDLSDNKREAAARLGESALAPIPDTVTFDEEYLRSVLEQSGGQDALERLDYVRTITDEGWTYTHHDLRADLSARDDAVQTLDSIRAFFRDGYSHKYRPLSSRRSSGRVGPALDGSRARLEAVSRYEWPAYLLTPVLLVLISLLGGTSWRSRVIWASSTVLISAGLVYALSWPMQQPIATAAAEQARAEVGLQVDGTFRGTLHLIDAKIGEIAMTVATDIVTGIRLYSLALAGAAAVVLLTAVFWPRVVALVDRARRAGPESYR